MDVTDKLQHYRRKRDFRQTVEPRGHTVAAAAGRSFVIQRHEARRLHFDFRLELGGVLKSWAVPKEPSMTPGEKRLAVHVEDHPLEYGDFEGVIPKGEYGGGNVEIWDRGEWIPERDADSDYRRGRLSFQLDGERLSGGWSLVRMGRRARGGKDNWLLIKRRDAAGVEPRSVRRQAVHRSRTGRLRVWRSNRRSREPHVVTASRIEGARAARLPTRIAPQLAQLVAVPPEGDAWIHEMKLDGYRILARRSRDAVQLDSRRGEDWTARFDSVARAVAELPVEDAILDGEVVLPDAHGVPDFQALQNVFSEGRTNEVVYYIFDLLHLDGYDLTGATLVDRKAALAQLLKSAPDHGPRIRLSDHVRGHAAEFFQEACKAGLEGIVSKRAADPYRPGRGSSWLKTKCRARQELVIAGYTDPAGARKGFGALVLGVHDRQGKLRYAGRVGTGFTEKTIDDLLPKLERLSSTHAPFAEPPKGPAARGVHWVEPKLVAEVEFAGWTSAGLLRAPGFKGLRSDKRADEVVVEMPRPLPARSARSGVSRRPARRERDTIDVGGVRITHPERLVYPDGKITKAHLARYYFAVAERMLPHISGRPLTLLRCPDGTTEECFYQRNAMEHVPQAVRRVKVRVKGGTSEYNAVDSVEGLLTLVQFGAVEIHPWGARADDLDHCDRLLFDLDPGENVPWRAIVETARRLRERLSSAKLESFVKTTGGKGLHLVVPLATAIPWTKAREVSSALARDLEARFPGRYVTTASKAARPGKIYIDHLRNAPGATAVAPYSARAFATATVSAPLRWEEVSRIRPGSFTVKSMSRRLRVGRADPWASFPSV